jgi:hypothetical protein
MLALILFSPLFGFLSGCFLGYRLGLGVCVISTLSIFCAFLSSLILFYNILISKVIYKINLGK